MTDKASTLHVLRTVTIEKFRGNGIAGKITNELFQNAQNKKYAVTSDCWYTPKFLKKAQNEEYNKLFKAKI